MIDDAKNQLTMIDDRDTINSTCDQQRVTKRHSISAGNKSKNFFQIASKLKIAKKSKDSTDVERFEQRARWADTIKEDRFAQKETVDQGEKPSAHVPLQTDFYIIEHARELELSAVLGVFADEFELNIREKNPGDDSFAVDETFLGRRAGEGDDDVVDERDAGAIGERDFLTDVRRASSSSSFSSDSDSGGR